MNTISKLIAKDLLKSLPKLNFENIWIYDIWQNKKQIRRSFQFENIVLTSMPLELIYMDLFIPTRTISL